MHKKPVIIEIQKLLRQIRNVFHKYFNGIGIKKGKIFLWHYFIMSDDLEFFVRSVEPLWYMSPCHKIYLVNPGQVLLYSPKPVWHQTKIPIALCPGICRGVVFFSSFQSFVFFFLCLPGRITSIHPQHYNIYFFIVHVPFPLTFQIGNIIA